MNKFGVRHGLERGVGAVGEPILGEGDSRWMANTRWQDDKKSRTGRLTDKVREFVLSRPKRIGEESEIKTRKRKDRELAWREGGEMKTRKGER